VRARGSTGHCECGRGRCAGCAHAEDGQGRL